MTAGEAFRGSPRPAGLFLSPSHLATLSSAGGPEPPGPSEVVSAPPPVPTETELCGGGSLPCLGGAEAGLGGAGASRTPGHNDGGGSMSLWPLRVFSLDLLWP